MPWKHLPRVTKCCGCVTDLKTATAIIAVLGIVTSPAVSWAVLRHAYVIRVSCFVTSSATRPDVVDINLNHILSFGFGANAGLGPSCLTPKSKNATTTPAPTFVFRSGVADAGMNSAFVTAVRWIGWVVLVLDIVFLGFSIYLLYKIFRPPEKKAALRFMMSCVVAILCSFIYGMLYVAACLSVGGAFPIFEFMFCIIDVMIWSMWIYFVIVEWSFVKYDIPEKQAIPSSIPLPIPIIAEYVQTYISTNFWGILYVWAYFLTVVNSYRRFTK